MKLKNCKVGTRVVVKKGVKNRYFEEGQTGIVEEVISEDGVVQVRFDHDGDHWYVPPKDLKLLDKEKTNVKDDEE